MSMIVAWMDLARRPEAMERHETCLSRSMCSSASQHATKAAGCAASHGHVRTRVARAMYRKGGFAASLLAGCACVASSMLWPTAAARSSSRTAHGGAARSEHCRM